MKRVVQFKNGVAVAIYDNISEASKATGFEKANIAKSIKKLGNKYIGDYYFEWEITNKELRQARSQDRKNRQAQKLKELEKEFHLK